LVARWQEVYTYVTANAVGQPATGIQSHSAGEFVWENGVYILHRNTIYGASVDFSMAGVPKINNDCSNIGSPTDIGTQSLRLSMDYSGRRVYMNNVIVADLDDVSMFPSTQWKGFSTGECRLSVYATSYNQDYFNFVVTELEGVGGSALAEEYIVDDVAPQMELVKGAYIDGFPKAVVGRTYPIPEVALIDEADPNVTVTAKVYRKDGAGDLINVTLKDGKFIPTNVGEYVVEYTAKDCAGNSSKLYYEVEALVCLDELGLTLSGEAENGETGKLLTLPVASVVNPQGIAEVKIFAKWQGGSEAQEIPVEGEGAYQFRPLHEGQWDIEYVYSDYMETKTETVTISVDRNVTPYIEKDVLIPKYMIKGATYQLPILEGYSFESGQPMMNQCQIFIQDDEGAERKIGGKSVTSYAKNKTTIIYRLESDGEIAEKRYQVPVIDVGYDTDQFFSLAVAAGSGKQSVNAVKHQYI
jgi:hypothetical protein